MSDSVKRAREEEEEEEEEENQRALDDELLQAGRNGTVEQARKALLSSSVNATTSDFSLTCLHLACMRDDWAVAEPIVRLLLKNRAAVNVFDDEDFTTPLHAASDSSSAVVVKMLIDKGASTECTSPNSHETPLHLCCRRSDEEAVLVASALLVAGADNSSRNYSEQTPLHLACQFGRPELVKLLLDSWRHLIKDVNAYNMTALHHAAENGAFGVHIIPMLLKAGVDIAAVSTHPPGGLNALDIAARGSFAMGEYVEKLCPELKLGAKMWYTHGDPVGAMAFAAERGVFTADDPYTFSHSQGRAEHVCWASLRRGGPLKLDGSGADLFALLEQRCQSETQWKWASSELPRRHPLTGDTIFHLLCRSKKLDVAQKLSVLKDLWTRRVNPLTPNHANLTAIHLCKEPEVRTALGWQMQWKPDKLVMDWFGPIFRSRVFTALLVMKRLSPDMNKDIKHMLVQYMSRVENIYVKNKTAK